jgi:hypothetical protein
VLRNAFTEACLETFGPQAGHGVPHIDRACAVWC